MSQWFPDEHFQTISTLQWPGLTQQHIEDPKYLNIDKSFSVSLHFPPWSVSINSKSFQSSFSCSILTCSFPNPSILSISSHLFQDFPITFLLLPSLFFPPLHPFQSLSILFNLFPSLPISSIPLQATFPWLSSFSLSPLFPFLMTQSLYINDQHLGYMPSVNWFWASC